ncbi:MAG: hypothetical protein JW742_09365 [Candidatus Aminicenantes bacterium]|nr:hypothetical protein [Candidatus Aminicenantes bacterium]
MTDTQRPEMLVPALIGGAVAGVLSGVPILSCLCCLWIIGGAMLAVRLTAKDSPRSLTSGDGAIVGMLTGIVAAIVESLVSLPLRAVNADFVKTLLERMAKYADDMPSGWESWIEGSAEAAPGPAWFLVGVIISAVLFAAFGALGGIIGVSLFGRKPSPPPGAGYAPPQDPSHRQP